MRIFGIAVFMSATVIAVTSAQAAPKPRVVYSKAHDACMAKADTTLDMANCNTAELKIRDAALNAAYAAALTRVEGAADAFKTAERAWIAYRDADCGVYENRDAFGTLGEVEAGACLIDRTIERTRDLQAFASEGSRSS
jgi:uncharacterized protein YecT (DUF1311 family)